jgi:hypothetical protein
MSEGAGNYSHSVTSEGAGGFNPLGESKNDAAFRPRHHTQSPEIPAFSSILRSRLSGPIRQTKRSLGTVYAISN